MKRFPRVFPMALLAVAAVPAQASLLFSEYVEGSSNNKALEIYNSGSTAVDLAAGNYRIAEYFNGSGTAGSTITLSGSVPAGGVFVIANSAAAATLTGLANQLSGALSFNGNDAVALLQGSSTVDVIGQIGVDPGSAGWGSNGTTTTDHTLRRQNGIVSGDTNGSDAFNPAQQWLAFATDTFDGLGCVGTAACGPGYTRIFQIQGRAHLSPLNGQTVANVPGLVTALAGTGFYLQDPDGDGDPATSDAIYIYTGSAPTVRVGQQLIVGGTVSEYRSGGSNNLTMTEITAPTVSDASGRAIFSHSSVTPTVIGSGGRVPPTQRIDSATASNVENSAHVFDPATNGIDFYESLEGMLVSLNNARVTGATDRFGDIWVVGDNGANATGNNSRGGITLVDRGSAGVDYNPERIELDPSLAGGASKAPLTSVGDHIASVSGVIGYAFSNYELLYTSVPSVGGGNLQPTQSTVSSGTDRLRIATYNLENLDANDSDHGGSPDCNDTDVADGRFSVLGQHIAQSLAAPDVLAVEEIQDNDGCTDDGVVAATTTLSTLLNAIKSAGGPTYSYAEIDPDNDQDGGQPGGNIRQVLLYNPARVGFIAGTLGAGGSRQATGLTTDSSAQPALTYGPGRIDPTNSAWASSRKPLAGMFAFNGQRVLVIANHFNSKGGDQPLYGPTQPPGLSSQTQRQQQTQIVHDFVAQALNQFPGLRVVALGDMNDYDFSAPLQTLSGQSAGTVILSDLSSSLLAPEERYSYVYQGNSQEIDHIYVSNALLSNAQVQAVHLNSEFATQASDHDPLIASLQIAAANQAPIANAGSNRTVAYAQTVTLDGSASRDPDGSISRYSWVQTAGTKVTLSSGSAAKPTFKAPSRATTLNFTLTVTDNAGASASAQVSIKVTSTGS